MERNFTSREHGWKCCSNDQYGGYNISIPGWSFPELRASCEYNGEDMDVVFGKPLHNETEYVLDTRDVFYYMVMLAEFGQGEVSFYIKTDYRPVNITLAESPEVGATGEEIRPVSWLTKAGNCAILAWE